MKKEMTFKGFKQISNLEYQQRTFTCKDSKCDNQCDVTLIKTEDGEMYHGDKCGKYEDKGSSAIVKTPFDIREDILMEYAYKNKPNKVTIGLPRVGMFYDMFPFWSNFFEELNMNLVTSEKTNNKIKSTGINIANKLAPEFCFPFKVAFGHFNSLEGKVDHIFAVDISESYRTKYENEKNTDWEKTRLCPYIQTFDTIVARNSVKEKVINPFLNLREPKEKSIKELNQKFSEVGLQISERKIKKAFEIAEEAYFGFKRRLRKQGQETISSLNSPEKGIVIVGRPYSIFDEEINLRLAKKIFQNEGEFIPIPMDFLPLPSEDLSQRWNNEFSVQGQNILNSANVIRKLGLNAVYLDYFACGPNSFLKTFFSRELQKPALTLQLDEHSADAGVITRLEAFLDSLEWGENERV